MRGREVNFPISHFLKSLAHSAVGAKRTTMKIEARAATTKLNLKNLNLDLFPYCTNIWLLL